MNAVTTMTVGAGSQLNYSGKLHNASAEPAASPNPARAR